MEHIGSWEYDGTHDRLTLSENTIEILGLSSQESEIPIQSFYQLIPSSDRQSVENIFHKPTHENQEAHSIVHKVVRQNTQTTRLVRTSWVNRRNDSDQIRSTGFIQDITDQQQNILDGKRHQRLQGNIPGMIVSYVLHEDGHTSFRYVNEKSIDLFGITPEELMQDATCLSSMIHPEDRELRDSTLAESIAEKKPWRQELRYIVDGRVRCYDCMTSPQPQPDGSILMDGIILEVTYRRQVEEAARESNRILRTLIENLPGFVYRCRNDRDWTMEFLGGRFMETTGYSPGDLIENNLISFNDLITEEYRDTLWALWQKNLRERKPLESEYTIQARDGSIKWVWEQGRGVYSDKGDLLALEGFICDITDRKKAEEERIKLEDQLRQSQKMEAIGQLAGGIAHDFNNILTAIIGNTQLSMNEIRDPNGEDKNIYISMELIEEAAFRASGLTRQLLTFSRRDVTQPKPLNLNQILSGLEKMLKRLITENIILEIKTFPELYTTMGDPGRLEQVIVNLVVNAIQAMPDGGRLTLETKNVYLDKDFLRCMPELKPSQYIQLAVSDTGHGMDTATRERIFEPFFTTKPAEKGTGLGLATVHGIVQQSGGHIIVYSEPGCGTTFKIYLPIIEKEPVDLQSMQTHHSAKGGDETILLCEDDRSVRELTTAILKTGGYTVIEASCGHEGIEKAKSHTDSIDLLITDVIMPDMNGRMLSEEIIRLRPDLSTLFISGYTSDVIAHHGVLDKDVAFLEKPFTQQDLLAKIRIILDEVHTPA